MTASIGSHFENIKLQSLQKYESDFHNFASKCAVFQILLSTIQLYFCVPFPLNRDAQRIVAHQVQIDML